MRRNTGRYGCHLGPMPLATSEFRRGLASFSNFVRLSCLDENRGAAQFGVKSGFLRLSRIRPGSCHLLEFRPAFFARTKTEEVAQFGNHATDRERSVYGCHWSSAIGGQPTYLSGGCLSSLHRQRAVYLPARGPRGAMGVGGPLAGARGPGGPKLTQARAIP